MGCENNPFKEATDRLKEKNDSMDPHPVFPRSFSSQFPSTWEALPLRDCAANVALKVLSNACQNNDTQEKRQKRRITWKVCWKIPEIEWEKKKEKRN